MQCKVSIALLPSEPDYNTVPSNNVSSCIQESCWQGTWSCHPSTSSNNPQPGCCGHHPRSTHTVLLDDHDRTRGGGGSCERYTGWSHDSCHGEVQGSLPEAAGCYLLQWFFYYWFAHCIIFNCKSTDAISWIVCVLFYFVWCSADSIHRVPRQGHIVRDTGVAVLGTRSRWAVRQRMERGLWAPAPAYRFMVPGMCVCDTA